MANQNFDHMLATKKIEKFFFKGLLTAFLLFSFGLDGYAQTEPTWPEITEENKPWTRWWWQGNAVDKANLSSDLEQLKNVNIGGVEITPIYGVAGYEDQFINYLSSDWMDMLEHTLREGDRLGLGIDMATGTGWPFGGPWTEQEHASKNLRYKILDVEGGQNIQRDLTYMQEPMLGMIGKRFNDPDQKQAEERDLTIKDIKEPVSANENLQSLAISQLRYEKPLELQTVMAYSGDGKIVDLTENVDGDSKLSWQAPQGNWILYALYQGWHGKMVERAAPGGEGLVIDHFSQEALDDYLSKFDQAFEGQDISSLRAFFNDSYEVDDASGEAAWTPKLFEEFKQRRGYDLRNHLPALLDEERDGAESERVRTDFRETISDLLLDRFTRPWQSWAKDNQAVIRNQAHGSPANILDLYASSDIPETEGTDIMRAKMASSAANVTGKPLIAAEAATWLDEHFQATLAETKTAVDRYFISGVNHIVYHGTAYSPDEARWPGWLFYAAVHYQPANPFWDHFEAFNSYVGRVQSFLQSGNADNDVLLYYPIHDRWAEPGRAMLQHFDGGIDEQFEGTAFKEAADLMQEEGYTFDFVSDRQITASESSGEAINTEGGTYKTILVPAVEYMPLGTLENILRLAQGGSTILMYKGLPKKVTGLSNLEKNKKAFKEQLGQLEFTDSGQLQSASLGKGKVLLSDDLSLLLSEGKIHREQMTDQGLEFVRRASKDGHHYFVTNWSEKQVDGWVPLSVEASSAAIFDPMQNGKGYAKMKKGSEGSTRIYLQLEPGESRIVKTFSGETHSTTYNYLAVTGEPKAIEGDWTIEFLEGGPVIPDEITTDNLQSWTKFEGSEYHNFSGTAQYTIEFEVPSHEGAGWQLDLGKVSESASVTVNGEEVGTVIGAPYQLFIPATLIDDSGSSTLTVEVASSMENRIAYMERENIFWKKFYNVNFPARLGENRNESGLFDASEWKPQESGLLGPVQLTPVKSVE
ncbi:glycosyl hydrolase [Fodinibius salsisoli]|uniref:Alpha-L-rhamnosidase n=1 Tax=Fodinibius salsisoli TaxID=2820877 RepID=A0ABT3PJD2_9BACT|nr:glycosyl hydrolase [Fodinibius salsisoli]MCW9705294.1 hypothetical protein [Fodinibius salsisoli]